jgi:DNA-binding SARP family transcriptional activator
VVAQLAAIEMLIGIARGRDDEVAIELGGLLELIPLGQGISEQFLRNNLVVPYVLVPASRSYWDDAPLGPSIIEARELAAALVSARAGDDAPLRRIRWPEPGVIACHFPCPWAIELALRRLHTRKVDGRRLATWLCEHWGEPARAALRSWSEDGDLGAVAQEVLANTPSPPPQRITLRLLGPIDVRVDGRPSDDPDLRRERVRALLVALALRPDTTRDQLAGQLWPDLTIDRAGKNLRTTLAYVHGVLEPDRTPGDAPWFVRTDGQQIRLHDSLDIDLWRFRDELDRADEAEWAGRPQRVLPLLIDAVERWDGDLAADLDHDWLDLERIHLRSRYVRACCRAAELLVALRDPTRAIAMARRALDVDRWSATAHASLAEAYDAIGDHTSARAVRERLEGLGVDG